MPSTGTRTCRPATATGCEVRWDGSITHQPSEVAWGGFCDLAEVASGKLALPFVPDGWQVLQRYVALYGSESPF